jgi:hypothetical protein
MSLKGRHRERPICQQVNNFAERNFTVKQNPLTRTSQNRGVCLGTTWRSHLAPGPCVQRSSRPQMCSCAYKLRRRPGNRAQLFVLEGRPATCSSPQICGPQGSVVLGSARVLAMLVPWLGLWLAVEATWRGIGEVDFGGAGNDTAHFATIFAPSRRDKRCNSSLVMWRMWQPCISASV